MDDNSDLMGRFGHLGGSRLLLPVGFNWVKPKPPIEEADPFDAVDMVEFAERENKLFEQLRARAFKNPEPKPEKPAKVRRKKTRLVKIFDLGNLDEAKEKAGRHSDKDARDRMKKDIDLARQNDGMRLVPDLKNKWQEVDRLKMRFPNFSDAIGGLIADLVINSTSAIEDYRFNPVLLDGAPGIGKTCFAQSLAGVLGVPFLKLSAGGLQSAAQICGSSSFWSNSSAGTIFDLIATNESAVAVVLIDEIEKVSKRGDYPIIPALLDLLEAESARIFKDQSVDVTFDASRLIIVATSNNKCEIDSALLSRMRVVDVKSPDFTQRKTIAEATFARLARKKAIALDAESVNLLCASGVDLREVNRCVRDAFVKAVIDRSKIARVVMGKIEIKRRIGF